MTRARRATPVLSAVLIAGVALSGCATKEAAKEATSSAVSSVSSSAAATTSATAAKPAGDKVPPADLPAVVNDRTYRGDDVFNNGEAFTWVGPDGKVVETTFVEGNPDGL